MKPRDVFGIIWMPLFALLVFGSFYVVWALLDLPSEDEVLRVAETYFNSYGLLTILIAAILEGILLAGWYFPGSLVIVLGVVLAHNDIRQVIGVFAVTTIGLLIAQIFNFFIGKHGWYRLLAALGFREALEHAERQLAEYGPRIIFLTYWHPNFGALTATAAGTLKTPFRTFLFYSAIALVVWDTLWTILGYSLGRAAITAIGPKFVIAFVVIWIAIAVGSALYKGRVTQEEVL